MNLTGIPNRKKCYFTYEQRKRLLESVRYVDLVIPEENWEQKISDVKEFKIDTFVMGRRLDRKIRFSERLLRGSISFQNAGNFYYSNKK